MKRLKIIVVSLLVVASVRVYAKPVLDIQRWRSDSGVPVYFVKAPQIPMLDIRVVFAAGSAHDGQNFGLAQLVNGLLNEGTESQNSQQIADAFDSVGAQMSGFVTRDIGGVALRTLTSPEYMQKALATFKDILLHPSFPADAIARVRGQQLAAINIAQQNPMKVASKEFYKALYGKKPYAHDPIGILTTVSAITPEQIKKFYQRYYVANNAQLIMVGDISDEQAKSIANTLTEGMPAGRVAPRIVVDAPDKQNVLLHYNFPSKQTAILLGQLGILRNNPDYFPLVVANAILGGLPSRSILYQQVRDKNGYAYYAFSQWNLLQGRGPFLVSLQTKNSTAKPALDLVRTILDEYVKNGPTQKQLIAAKRYLVGSFALSIDSNQEIMEIVTNMVFYHRPLDFLDTYRSNIESVTLAQIQAALQKYLQPNKMIVITTGPGAVNGNG